MSSETHRGGVPALRAQHPRVLVAEDDDSMRELVAEILRAEGCEVEELADGEQLMARVIAEARPRADLIVSDVRMPVCSGLAVLQKLREEHRMIPMILTTAFGDAWQRARVEALGGVLLDKPFGAQALRSAARALLVRRPE